MVVKYRTKNSDISICEDTQISPGQDPYQTGLVAFGGVEGIHDLWGSTTWWAFHDSTVY